MSQIILPPPVIKRHEGVYVVRDDLLGHGSGTKARFMVRMFEQAEEIVYATPAEGGAQTALAWAARECGCRATLFVAARQRRHPRTALAAALGAKIAEVRPGYLNVAQARAREYAQAAGATLAPFGLNTVAAIETLAAAAVSADFEPDEVWCAAGSGALARALAKAWPQARRYAVQVGRALTPAQVAGAQIHRCPLPFRKTAETQPPFPSDSHYDAKAWAICRREKGAGRVLFWNVAGNP